jgi:mannose-6-phosphate isomerase-like protein (cupin superfamily)
MPHVQADFRREERKMLGWVGEIEQATVDNTTFRTVIFTGKHTQLTVMSIAAGEDIGREVHHDRDQFIRIEQGRERVEFSKSAEGVDETHDVEADWAVIVPAGIWHNVINTSDGELKLYSLYSPPEHPDGIVHVTKADALSAEHS